MNNYAIVQSLLIKYEKVTKAMREAKKFGMNKNSFIETREQHGIKNWKKSRKKYLNSNRAVDESESESNDKDKIFSPYSPCSPKWTQSSPKWTQSSPKWTWSWKDERKDSGISEIIMNTENEDDSTYIHSLPLDENHNDSHNHNHNMDDNEEYVLNIDKVSNMDDNDDYVLNNDKVSNMDDNDDYVLNIDKVSNMDDNKETEDIIVNNFLFSDNDNTNVSSFMEIILEQKVNC
jgi:hypothetical protein